jgi:hypothetical protein
MNNLTKVTLTPIFLTAIGMVACPNIATANPTVAPMAAIAIQFQAPGNTGSLSIDPNGNIKLDLNGSKIDINGINSISSAVPTDNNAVAIAKIVAEQSTVEARYYSTFAYSMPVSISNSSTFQGTSPNNIVINDSLSVIP